MPEFADVTDQVEWKISGISIYASQLDRLFGGAGPMAADGPLVRAARRRPRRGARLRRALLGLDPAVAERSDGDARPPDRAGHGHRPRGPSDRSTWSSSALGLIAARRRCEPSSCRRRGSGPTWTSSPPGRTGSRRTRSVEAYRTDLAFPPVMVYVFWVARDRRAGLPDRDRCLGSGRPAGAQGPGDPGRCRSGRSVSPTCSGIDPAGRSRRRSGVLLSPVVIYTSAWWGQFESIYVLAGLVAAILAIGGRPYLAAIALGVALMAKPQALAFVPPFAAWALGPARLAVGVRLSERRRRRRRSSSCGCRSSPTVVRWPISTTLGRHQTQIFAIMSLRAWNPWWMLQTLDRRGRASWPTVGRSSDRCRRGSSATSSSACSRSSSSGRSGRAPTKRGLLLGLAASTLVLFGFLTSVHERYAYAALDLPRAAHPRSTGPGDVARR